MHIMVDLETWGRKPGCALRSIGAVPFDPMRGVVGERTFYANITRASCEEVGLTVDEETAAWWADQSADAQRALLEDQRPLVAVLNDFTQWWSDVSGVEVWGHGATFDPPILEGAYAAVFMDAPWKFWNVRCCRTILALGNRRPDLRGSETKHNALHDAVAQARAVNATLKAGLKF